MRISYDEGRTWSDGKVINPGPSAYSSLTICKDGSIGVLYEPGYKAVRFARFTLEDLTDGKDKLSRPYILKLLPRAPAGYGVGMRWCNSYARVEMSGADVCRTVSCFVAGYNANWAVEVAATNVGLDPRFTCGFPGQNQRPRWSERK